MVKPEKYTEEKLKNANKELAFQSERTEELIIANEELTLQNKEKEKCAEELIIANKELAFQSEEKENRAGELTTAKGKLKEAEDDIHKVNKELEQNLTHNGEIEKENEVLNHLNLEKDRFVGIVSHDLQNDISAMKLTLGMLEKNTEVKNENQLKYIKRLSRSVANMYRLSTEFLTINRIQQGLINPDYSLVDIASEVGKMVEEYSYIGNLKNIKLNYTNECNEFLLNTDKNYVGIIVSNLISNAIKYSPIGGEINIKTSKTNDKYCFEVEDNGPGIPPSDLPKLYGRFQKLTAKPTGGESSNGLGLSIVKELIDALKATIECKSQQGRGTTFIVSFSSL